MKRRLGYTALTGALAALPFLLGAPDLAHAQQAPGSGSFPNSFLIPGTNTSLRVGGFVKLDAWYDFSTHGDTGQNGGTTGMSVGGIPLDDNKPGDNATNLQGHSFHGRMAWSAAESRFNFESRTPTAWGEVKTFLELDLEQPSGLVNTGGVRGNSDSIAPRLRQAYGTFGPWLFGQTFPLFSDGIASPETLDFAGDSALAGPLRIPEIRYTFDAGNGITLAAALDDESIVFDNGVSGGQSTSFSPCGGTAVGTCVITNANSSSNIAAGYKLPAAVLNGTLSQAWGHVSLRGLLRDLYYHGPSNVQAGADSKIERFGWGAGFSGDFHLPTGLRDAILWQANGGRGIGRFINNEGTNQGDFVVDAGGTPHLIDAWNATLGVIHYWTDQLRSNADGEISYFVIPHGGGIWATEAAGSAFGSFNRAIYGAHANLIWSPIPAMDLGAEYIFLERIVEDGRHGIGHRLQFSSKFRF
ncbi:MAG TPA: DcaP family trimeric outer membrane transporter [Stellaceae bacterium]|nr:DcaP family trimeric outer membrane transporter [Stellaceae bacterium]